jgi:hypothetical protein
MTAIALVSAVDGSISIPSFQILYFIRRTVMNTITIKDLCTTEELTQQEMAAVHGGTKSLGQAIGDGVNAVADGIGLVLGLATGACEVSKTGKSIVCY